MDFVEICNVCARKAIIEAAKRIILILIRFAVVIVILILASLFWNTVYSAIVKRYLAFQLSHFAYLSR